MTESVPLPEATPVSAPFWQALTEHRILVQFSPSLGRYVFYPRTLAPGTLADDLSGVKSTATERYTRSPWRAGLPAHRGRMRCRRSSPSSSGT